MGNDTAPAQATRTRAEMLKADATTDAARLDRTPFTPRGVGEVFGSQLAMIAALATCVLELEQA